jgi:hypothetical protein
MMNSIVEKRMYEAERAKDLYEELELESNTTRLRVAEQLLVLAIKQMGNTLKYDYFDHIGSKLKLTAKD